MSWTHTFLTDQTVKLKFNGLTSDPFESDVGTPQGSPISPVLAVLYTHALLHKAEVHQTSLSMYVDDGTIFAYGHTWKDVETSLASVYATSTSWLEHSGLTAEPDKMELIFFKR